MVRSTDASQAAVPPDSLLTQCKLEPVAEDRAPRGRLEPRVHGTPVARARRALADWTKTSFAERARIFLRFHDLVLDRQEQALDLIQRVLIRHGDRVAVEDPGYPPPRWLFQSLGLRVIERDDDQLVCADVLGDTVDELLVRFPGSLARVGPGVLLLAEHLLLGPGATLEVTERDAHELRIASGPDGFASLIGVGASNLVSDAVQLSLAPSRDERQESLSAAFDRVRRKYGRKSLQTGRTAFDEATAEDFALEKRTGLSSQMP